MRNKILKIIGIPSVFLALMFLFKGEDFYHSAYAQTTATVSVQPNVTSTSVGNQVTVNINIANGSHLASYDLKLTYDPSVFTVETPTSDVINGSYLNPTVNVAYRNVNNGTGVVQFAAYSDAGLNNGKSGSGTLAIVKLRATNPGTSPLTLSDVLLVHDDLDATLQANNLTNSSVTVTSTASPRPSPSATPGATPRPTPSSTPRPTPRPTPSATPTASATPGPSPTTAPGTAAVILKVRLEGVTTMRPDDRFIDVVIKQGTTTIESQSVRVRSDAQGVYSNANSDPAKLVDIPIGTYDFLIDGPVHLTRKFTNKTLTEGSNLVDLTTPLLTGDIQDNNTIDLSDYNRIVENFGCVAGEAAPAGKNCTPIDSDLDLDLDVDIFDYGFLVCNYGVSGNQ